MANLKNDIERYLRGELSPAEMYELEKLALQDPFLAEALEGAQQTGAEDFLLDLDMLQEAIYKKTKKRKTKVVSFYGWNASMSIAAAILLLIVSSFVLFFIIGKHSDENLASESKSIQDTDKESAALDSVTNNKRDSLLLADNTTDYKTNSVVESAEQQDRITNNKETSNTNAPVHEEESIIRSDAFAANDETDNHTSNKIQLSESEQASHDSLRVDPLIAGNDKNSISAKVVRGKVTSSEDGAGLPGVNILIQGTSIGTVTDAEGRYEIKLTNEKQNKLVFAFIGYVSQEVDIARKEDVNVQLDVDVTSLSEVVVVGYSPAVIEPPPTLQFAEPHGGRKAYKKYLEEKLQYPQRAIENKIEGKVTVQFTVEPNGQLNNFKVIKGLGYGCEDEVLRLIKQGPAWAPTKQNGSPVKDQVKVRLKFKLPGN